MIDKNFFPLDVSSTRDVNMLQFHGKRSYFSSILGFHSLLHYAVNPGEVNINCIHLGSEQII